MPVGPFSFEDLVIPSIPQNLYITTGNGQNLIQWEQVVGATTYTIQRSLTGVVGSFSTIGTSPIPSYLDTTVTSGINYWYQIASSNSDGTSPYATLGTNGLELSITPCLPGQINLGYLRYMSKLKADKLNSQFLTDDEWDFNINQSTNRLYDVLVTKYGEDYFLAPALQIPTNGTANYLLPNGSNYNAAPAIYKLVGVDVGINASNNQWFSVPRYNFADRNRYSTLQLAGTVQSIYGLSYREMGNMITFIPLPTNAQTFQLWYVPILQQMLQDTDMMPFSTSGWSEIVIVDAAIKALIKEESYEQAQALVTERTELLSRIQEASANRDVGQPNTVSNTRARMGDQNFGSFGGFGGFNNGSGWGG